MNTRAILFFVIIYLITCCTSNPKEDEDIITAFINATLIDGTGDSPIDNSVLIISKGKVVAVGSRESVQIPNTAIVIDLMGKTIMPGIINAHGHIGGTTGLIASYSKDNVMRDLKLNAAYGITTVFSLGGDEKQSIAIRDEQDSTTLNRSRLFVAGDVVIGNTPAEARAAVDKNAAMKVDIIKIRVDDNLGATEKMQPEIYEAVIDQAKKYNLPVAAHIFYLEDAKAMLRLGVRFIAHSVRDVEVDEEFITLMKEKDAYYCPTLMREVSVFVYESTPSFFEDPFFLSHADTAIMKLLQQPERQKKMKDNPNTPKYKQALALAKKNLKMLSDAGVKIAFGTDAGPPARFQGYFEHMELEQMVDAGLTPMQTIVSATRDAVSGHYKENLGTLEVGKYADFLVLSGNPLDDIKNSRKIESVWIGGNRNDQP